MGNCSTSSKLDKPEGIKKNSFINKLDSINVDRNKRLSNDEIKLEQLFFFNINSNRKLNFKVLLIGDSGVGKTNILNKLIVIFFHFKIF